MNSSNSKNIKTILLNIVIFLITEAILLPAYFSGMVPLMFNDSGSSPKNIADALTRLIFFFFMIVVIIAIFFVLKKIRYNTKISSVLFVIVNIFIVLFMASLYMEAYLPKDINEKINPYTSIVTKREEASDSKIINNQIKRYKEYLENKSEYTEIYNKNIQGTSYKLCLKKDVKELFLVYESANVNYIISTPQVQSEPNQISKSDELLINDSSLGAIFINTYNDNAFIRIESENIIFPLRYYTTISYKSSKYLHVDNILLATKESFNIGEKFLSIIIEHLQPYELKYKDGIIQRNSEPSDGLTWVFLKNDKVILKRNAENETELKLLSLSTTFDKDIEYSCYLEAFILDKYTKVSNVTTFIISK